MSEKASFRPWLEGSSKGERQRVDSVIPRPGPEIRRWDPSVDCPYSPGQLLERRRAVAEARGLCSYPEYT